MNPWIPVSLCLPPERLLVEVLAGKDTPEKLEDPAGKPLKRFVLNGRWLTASNVSANWQGRRPTTHWRYVDETPMGAGDPGASA